MGTEVLTVRDLEFEVCRSARRKTLEIIVDRGGELRVLAPEDLGHGLIEDFICEKRFWIYTKLAEKEKLTRPQSPKEYVSGEGFHYLGRTYRLLLVDGQDVPVKLTKGRLCMLRPAAAEGRKHLIRWYTSHARAWLERRADPWARRMRVVPGAVRVLDLGHRWGSCSPNGAVNFHWATIQLPPSVIDYVIVHELAHRLEPRHTPEFWLRVERAMPDFEERKQSLVEYGAGYVWT